MKRYRILIVPLILVLLFFIAFYYTISKDKQDSRSEARRQIDDYPLLKDIKIDITIEGLTLAKELSLNMYNKGSYLIDLENGTKFSLFGASRNYLYKPEPNLNRFLEIGDSIFVSTNNDSVFVYRNNKKYYFILGKIINKKG